MSDFRLNCLVRLLCWCLSMIKVVSLHLTLLKSLFFFLHLVLFNILFLIHFILVTACSIGLFLLWLLNWLLLFLLLSLLDSVSLSSGSIILLVLHCLS